MHRLAGLYGLQIGYTDAAKQRRRASANSLLAVLEVLGAPVRSMADAPGAIRERERALRSRVVQPVTVVWDGEPAEVMVTVPGRASDGLRLEVVLETGEPWPVSRHALTRAPRERTDVGGATFVRRRVPVNGLPPGYHTIVVRSGTIEARGMVLCAPIRCVAGPDRAWGAFLPLHAVRSRRNWGCGDLTDLPELLALVEGLGGTTVGTLPLLSTFLDQPFDPSPYAPVSRLFWNELFIDVERVPEAGGSGEAGNIMGSPRFRKEIGRVRRSRLVDYRAVATLKREVLQALAGTFFTGPGNRREMLARFLRERPELRSYATFRAAAERHRAGWQEWPSPGRDGRIPTSDADPHAVRYHQYVQFVAEDQLQMSRRGEPGRGLYVDLPVGVNPGGYDTWRFRTAFAQGASTGAPPDVFFAEGQDWGFPPMHPDRARDDGYAYFRATVSNLLRHAAMLRIDHAMGLHRMYWIPRGLDATAGVYVRYRPEELYAVLTLESHRAGVPIVGEDLGTVPPDVRPAMSRHGVLRSYVLQLEALARSGLRGPVRESLASLNTHDMPPFRAFWEGLDIEDRMARGVIDRASARRERVERATQRRMLRDRLRGAGFRVGKDPRSVAAGALRYLAAGPSKVVVVNLEDLWGETEPQNRPGTGPEQPNWRRKAARTIAQARSDPAVTGTLEEINRLRRRGQRPGASR